MAVAPSKPPPGTVAIRRARSFERNEASRSRSSCRMRHWTSIACSAKAAITFVARSGTSFASPAAARRTNARALVMPLGMAMPNSARSPRIILTSWVRWRTRRSRVRCTASGLLLDRLDRYEAHGRSGDRLADRLRITGISLAPLHVRLDVGRRHQPHLVTETDQLSRPMMARAARLHADETRRELAEERDHLSPS